MNTEDLHRPQYVPDLLAAALNQTPNRAFLELAGGPTLTVGEMRDATSRFIQALQSLGVNRDTRVATLSTNRPEVLHVAHAIQLLAAVAVPMHPLAGLADHLNVVLDAGVEVLVFDPTRFNERAAELAKQAPNMKLIAFGASQVAEDLCKLAERFTPAPLVAPKVTGSTIARLSYSGGTTGKPKALPGTQRSAIAAAQIMLAEWEWPSPPRVLSCTPLSHAGSGMILPTLLKQGTISIQPGFDALAVMQGIQDASLQLHDDGADHDLCASGPSSV